MAADSETWPSSSLLQRVRDSVMSLSEYTEDQMHFAVSPYRICPLGAHIDHQDSSCGTGRISDRYGDQQGVVLGFTPSDDMTIKIKSRQFQSTLQFSMNSIPLPKLSRISRGVPTEAEDTSWAEYARGAVYALQMKGYKLTKGLIGYLEGSHGFDGGGLSSSAAVGVAYLLALELVNGIEVSREENVELDRLIENDYLGLKNGVLDQSAILLSEQDCLSLFHCKTRECVILAPKRLDSRSFKILIAFSGLRHALSSKPGYNARVEECRDAARALLRMVGRERSEPLLSDVSFEEYYEHREKLSDGPAKRAEHFFTELQRVFAGIQEWEKGDVVQFGALITQSGKSSIENYECGCEPLIQLQTIMLEAPGVYGARFSGAGFRGCCVGLVASSKALEAAAYIDQKFRSVQPDLAKHITDVAVICESGKKAHILGVDFSET